MLRLVFIIFLSVGAVAIWSAISASPGCSSNSGNREPAARPPSVEADTAPAATLKPEEVIPAGAANLERDKDQTTGKPAASSEQRRVLTEHEKIDFLIAHIASMEGAKFIRNGIAYDAPEAAKHLRRKWEYGKGKIKTARQFIEHIASRSSITGTLYRIRKATGEEVLTGEYLSAELDRLADASRRTNAEVTE